MTMLNYNDQTPPFKPIQVSLKYLCENDPNYKKLGESKGWVMVPEDAPTHLNGWSTNIENVQKKHRTMGGDGREVEWSSTHQVATWKCQTCGATKKIDPWP